MLPNRFLLALLMVPCCGGAAMGQDALDPGIKLVLSGNLEMAADLFDMALQENPDDSRAKELLGNCLIVAGKDAMRDRRYAEGREALERAGALLGQKEDLRMLGMLAELEEEVPSGAVAVSSTSLDTTAETSAIYECIFGNGDCAKGGKYVIHVVETGETMADIAAKYYNDLNKWERIWKRNPQISNPHRLVKGVKLIIPLP